MGRGKQLLSVLGLVLGLMGILSWSVSASREESAPARIESSYPIGRDLPTGVYSDEITTEEPMGFPGVTLAFAPGAEGWVTVTLTDTPPVGLPTGALSASWQLTTSAPTYDVTATFDYGKIVRRSDGVDVVLAVDRSTSMEDQTRCWGCWAPVDGVTYPDGQRNPLPWDTNNNDTPDHCEGNTPLTYDGATYIIIEAEEYGRLSQPYQPDFTDIGMTYWTLQRNGGFGVTSLPAYMRNDDGAGSLGRDALGGYLSHLPPRSYLNSDGFGVPCSWADLNDGEYCRRSDFIESMGGPFWAPRADDDFEVPESGTWYLWFRGQSGDSDHLFWGLDGTPIGQTYVDASGASANGADPSKWNWKRAGCGEGNAQPCAQALISGTTYTLNVWAGGVGFDLDRLIVTDNPDDPDTFFQDNDLVPVPAYTNLVSDVLSAPASSIADNNRTGWACAPCDARFGGSPEPAAGEPLCTASMVPQPYRYLDALYDDEQPMRGTVEAFKTFPRGLDPTRDQVGVIAYGTTASVASDLQCESRLGGGCITQVFTDTVIAALDDIHAGGTTNLAHALLLGIQMLDPQTGSHARKEVGKVLVVISDGEPDAWDGLETPACYEEDLWPQTSRTPTIDKAKDCAIYYARQARDQGIVLYPITLGDAADIELMQAIAEMTGGVLRHAPHHEQISPILDEILTYATRLRANGSMGIYHRADAVESWQLYPLALTDWMGFQVTGREITQFSHWTLAPLSPTMVLTVTAELDSLPVGGATTLMTATVRDLHGDAVDDGTPVTFTTNLGTWIGSGTASLPTTTHGGVATAMLRSGVDTGTATVLATAGAASDVTAITFTPGPLNRFAVSPLEDQEVGRPFTLTLTAQDAYSNVVVGFTDTVTLMDATGTLSPTTTGAFTSGVWKGRVEIGAATTDVIITATYHETTGVSNPITVTESPQPPAVPIRLAPPDGHVTHTQAITLTWQAGASSAPDGYRVDLDGGVITTTDRHSATILSTGVHTWTIQAYNTVGVSEWTPTWSIEVVKYTLYLPLVVRDEPPSR